MRLAAAQCHMVKPPCMWREALGVRWWKWRTVACVCVCPCTQEVGWWEELAGVVVADSHHRICSLLNSLCETVLPLSFLAPSHTLSGQNWYEVKTRQDSVITNQNTNMSDRQRENFLMNLLRPKNTLGSIKRSDPRRSASVPVGKGMSGTDPWSVCVSPSWCVLETDGGRDQSGWQTLIFRSDSQSSGNILWAAHSPGS